jgi:RNA polymerase sigma-70 factor (ECF subfamily)
MMGVQPDKPITSVPDAQVIQRSLAEPEHFGLLFDRHAPTVRAYLRGRLGSAEADGLVVDTFAAAFFSRTTFDGRSDNALPWLLGFARNLARNDRRSDRRFAILRSRLRTADRAEGPAVDVSARVDAERLGVRVRQTVSDLPADQQDVLLLHALGALSYAQIAEMLDIPIGTVRSRLARARRYLRTALADLAPEEDADERA